MAHMVEHLLLHPRDVNDIDDYMYRSNIDWYSQSEHIYFVYDEFIMDQNKIKSVLNTDNITQEIIDYEYSIFEEEFGNRSYILRLMDKCAQAKYWVDWSSKPVKYTIDEIKQYIDKYIINGQYIYYYSHDDKIIDTNIKYDNFACRSWYSSLDYEMVLLQWSKNHIFTKKIESIYDFVLQEFISKIFTQYDLYQKRYILGSYYYTPSTMFSNSEYIAIRNSTDNILSISEVFFDSFKKYYINLIRDNQFEITNIDWLMYTSQYAPKQEMIKYIWNIPYGYIKNLIEMIKK